MIWSRLLYPYINVNSTCLDLFICFQTFMISYSIIYQHSQKYLLQQWPLIDHSPHYNIYGISPYFKYHLLTLVPTSTNKLVSHKWITEICDMQPLCIQLCHLEHELQIDYFSSTSWCWIVFYSFAPCKTSQNLILYLYIMPFCVYYNLTKDTWIENGCSDICKNKNMANLHHIVSNWVPGLCILCSGPI